MLDKSYNKPKSEFEVQAECYALLSEHFITRGEVKLEFERPKDENGKTLTIQGRKVKRQRGARFDLVCYSDTGKAIFTVEVKRIEGIKNSKQSYYEEISGIPCYTVGSVEECSTVISEVK